MYKPKKRGWGKFVNFNLQDENFTKAVKEIKQIRVFKLLLKIESFKLNLKLFKLKLKLFR